ncbi:hypothetical protein [Chitiniphilus shinanonensis]|uniref:hypothetical protein n=1 Tax=Chitiniphilus shinanonensis TaxID=553088 RepID=UPI003020D622
MRHPLLFLLLAGAAAAAPPSPHPLRLTGQYVCADDVQFHVRANIDGRTIYLYTPHRVFPLQQRARADGFEWRNPELTWEGTSEASTLRNDHGVVARDCRKR